MSVPAFLLQKLSDGSELSADERASLVGLLSPVQVPAAPAPALNLTPLPSPANGDGSVTREQLDAWTALYGIQHRQLRRMIARGREKKEPCPLDDPRKMPAWVEKHVEKVRAELWDKVNAAAAEAAPEPAPAPKTDAAPVPLPSSTPAGMVIDLATVGGVEGESVELFRRLFAAAKIEVEAAYKSGSETEKLKLHSRLEKLGESVRKHEAAAEAKAKRRGELLTKAEVFTALAECLNVLRMMREQREKRVRAQLSDLSPELLERVLSAVHQATVREDDVFANLPLLKSADDLLLKLAA